MKPYVTVSITVFVIAIASILLANAFSAPAGNNKTSSVNTVGQINTNTTQNNSTASQPQTTTGSPTFTMTDISKHSSTSDCWLLINNNVYDVSSFMNQHPGGIGTIAPYCGKEATQAFNTKDQRRAQPHSQSANSLLNDYLIGVLAQ